MFINYFLFNKTINLFLQFICVSSYLYDYKFVFSKLSGPRAYPPFARGYGQGMGLKLAGRAGPGPTIHGLGRAWVGPGPKF